MQTELTLFESTPTKGEIVCRRIVQRCLEAGTRPNKRTFKMISIHEIILRYGND